MENRIKDVLNEEKNDFKAKFNELEGMKINNFVELSKYKYLNEPFLSRVRFYHNDVIEICKRFLWFHGIDVTGDSQSTLFSGLSHLLQKFSEVGCFLLSKYRAL